MEKEYFINPLIKFAEELPAFQAEGKYEEVKGTPEEYGYGLVQRLVSEDDDTCDIEYFRWPQSDAVFEDCIKLDIDGYNNGTDDIMQVKMNYFNEPNDSDYTFVTFPTHLRGKDYLVEICYFAVGNDYLSFELLSKTRKFYLNNCGLSIMLPCVAKDTPKTKVQIEEDGMIFGSKQIEDWLPAIEIYTWERDGDFDHLLEYISNRFDLREAVKTDIKLASGESIPGMKLRYYTDKSEDSKSNIEWVLDLGERYASLRFEYDRDFECQEAYARAILASLKTDKEPIIFYQYFATTDLEDFKKKILKKFKETGHDRDIEFRVWVCDDDIPYRDGDIYTYDAFAIKFLVDNDYIRELPEIIDTSDVFPWVLDTTKVNGKTYGFPWMLCFDAVISRKKDYKPVYTDADLQDNIVIPVGTYAPIYFYTTSALSLEPMPTPKDVDVYDTKAFQYLKKIAKITGNVEKAVSMHYKDPETLEEFTSGRKKYIAQFPEIINVFPKDDYAVNHMGFINTEGDDTNLYYVDFISIGKNVKEEKLLDCLDLAEILCSEEFIYDLCAPEGKPNYMCPSHKALYPRLAKLDEIYNNFLDIVSDPNNSAIRFKTNFYEFQPDITERVFAAYDRFIEEEKSK